MANKSSKGSAFERQVCKQLSLWWTDWERDDIYWRTSQSGGRATSRTKAGKTTAGQYGDITCVDPDGVGSELTKLFSIELKKGYGPWSFVDLIARTTSPKTHPFRRFWAQVEQQVESSEVFLPMLIVQRSGSAPLLILEGTTMRALLPLKACRLPHVSLVAFEYNVVATRLEHFLENTDPDAVVQLWKGMNDAD